MASFSSCSSLPIAVTFLVECTINPPAQAHVSARAEINYDYMWFFILSAGSSIVIELCDIFLSSFVVF